MQRGLVLAAGTGTRRLRAAAAKRSLYPHCEHEHAGASDGVAPANTATCSISRVPMEDCSSLTADGGVSAGAAAGMRCGGCAPVTMTSHSRQDKKVTTETVRWMDLMQEK